MSGLPAMPRPTATHHNILWMLSLSRKLRGIVVLLIAVTIGLLLAEFPEALIQKVSQPSHFFPERAQNVPIDAGAWTTELHQRARAAMAELEAKNERVNDKR